MRSTDLLGFLLIGNALTVVAWWLLANKPNPALAVLVAALAIFIGVVFIFNERISEITIARVGSIKTAAIQATGDAAEIAAIKRRIEAQAATVDLVAGKATEAERLSRELEATLGKAQETVGRLEALASFTNTVVAAQNDDRKAFDQLETWGLDSTFPYQKSAAQAFETIFNDSAHPLAVHYDVPWKAGIDPSKQTFQELKDIFEQAHHKEVKYSLLQYIQSRNDIALKDRLDFFASVMRTSESLSTVEIAGRCFTQLTKQKIKPLAVRFLLKWWSENQDKDPADLEKAATGEIDQPNGAKSSPAPGASP